MHFFRNLNTTNGKNVPAHKGIYKSEKIQEAFGREIKS